MKMKTVIRSILTLFVSLLPGLIISVNSHAWSFSFDDIDWSNSTGSGSYYRSGDYYGYDNNQHVRNMRIVKGQDHDNFYLYIELQGLTPQEVEIQREGNSLAIRQLSGRKESSESRNSYRAWESFSSFTRRLSLPPGADPDATKMTREHQANTIRLTIPKLPMRPWGRGY
jgi:HSP20 family molecular chaperone IbpA